MCENCSNAFFNDAGFRLCDVLNRVAEVIGVINADWRDHADDRLHHVRRIPFATKSNFHDRDINRSVCENCECQTGEHFEVRHRRTTLGHAFAIDNR